MEGATCAAAVEAGAASVPRTRPPTSGKRLRGDSALLAPGARACVRRLSKALYRVTETRARRVGKREKTFDEASEEADCHRLSLFSERRRGRVCCRLGRLGACRRRRRSCSRKRAERRSRSRVPPSRRPRRAGPTRRPPAPGAFDDGGTAASLSGGKKKRRKKDPTLASVCSRIVSASREEETSRRVRGRRPCAPCARGRSRRARRGVRAYTPKSASIRMSFQINPIETLESSNALSRARVNTLEIAPSRERERERERASYRLSLTHSQTPYVES